MKALKWINNNPSETCLIFVFLYSLAPFIKSGMRGSDLFLLGFLSVVSSIGFLKFCPEYEKSKKELFQVLGMIILILGVTFMICSEQKWMCRNIFLFLSTYLGGLFGFIFGCAVFFGTRYKK